MKLKFLKRLLSSHKLPIIFAIITGLIFSFGNVYLWFKRGDNVFSPFMGGDENLYAAQIKHFFLGRFGGDPFLFETRYTAFNLPFIPPLALGLAARIIGSVGNIFILGDFLFPVINFLLIYSLIFYLGNNRYLSLLGATATIGFYHITSSFPLGFWEKITFARDHFYAFGRLVPIQFTYIFFCLFLIFLAISLRTRKITYSLLCGFLAGLLAYIYFYHWSGAMAILIFCLVLSIMFDKKLTISLILATGIALITSSYYLFNLLTPGAVNFAARFGLVEGRFAEPLLSLRYVLFAFVFIILSKSLKIAVWKKIFYFALAFSALACVNIQLFSGFTVAPGHWPWSTFEPLIVMIIFSLFRFPVAKRLFFILSFLLFAHILIGQKTIHDRWAHLYYLNGEDLQLLEFLHNQDKDKVVLTVDKSLSRLLSAWVPQYQYLPYGSYTGLGDNELWERVLVAFAIYGYTLDKVEEKVHDSQFVGQIFDQTYNFHQRNLTGNILLPQDVAAQVAEKNPFFDFGVRYIPDNIVTQKKIEYNQVKSRGLEKNICRYKIDYLVATAEEIGNQKEWHTVFANSKYRIYEKNNICSK